MKYQILTGRNPQDLSGAVNRMIQEGWLPIGGVCCADDGSKMNEQCWTFSQAMTKIEQARPYLDLDAPIQGFQGLQR